MTNTELNSKLPEHIDLKTHKDLLNKLFDTMEESGFTIDEFNDDGTFVVITENPSKTFKVNLVYLEEITVVNVYLTREEDETRYMFGFDYEDDYLNGGVAGKLAKIKYDTEAQRREEKEKQEVENNLQSLAKELRIKTLNFNAELENVKRELEVLKSLQDTYDKLDGEHKFYDNVKGKYISYAKDFIEYLEEDF